MAKPPRFHTRPFPRRKRRRRLWPRLRPLLTFVLLLGAFLVFRQFTHVPEEWAPAPRGLSICGSGPSAAGCVIDGDTIAIGQRRIRLTGYNAPELAGECAAETALALRARDELHRWINAGPVSFDGGTQPPYDKYGRELRAARRVAANGRTEDLATHMIDAGLAQSTGWGAVRGGWC